MVDTLILKRLKELMKQKNWSKAEFARKMGIKAQNVNKYLNGELDISGLFLQLHLEGCDINWLISGVKPELTSNCDQCNYQSRYYEIRNENIEMAQQIDYYESQKLAKNYMTQNWFSFLTGVYANRATEIRGRMIQLREHYNFDYTAYGPIGDIPSDVIEKIENNELPLTLEYLMAIADSGITNILWLLTGRGKMTQSDIECTAQIYTLLEIENLYNQKQIENHELRGQIKYLEAELKKFKKLELECFVEHFAKQSNQELNNKYQNQ